jgi:hypothetical protein
LLVFLLLIRVFVGWLEEVFVVTGTQNDFQNELRPPLHAIEPNTNTAIHNVRSRANPQPKL